MYKLLSALVIVIGYSNTPLQSYSGIEAFQDNPHLDEKMRSMIAPHLIPINHPMKETLDYIFSQSRVIENEKTLLEAGFEIIAKMQVSYVIVARHPAVPGFVFKLYLDSEVRTRGGLPNWKWLCKRCSGAQKIRKIIAEKKLHHFSVPDKWLYVLPQYPLSHEVQPQPVILMETDMELESEEITRLTWKSRVKPKHLDELYAIIKHGYGTIHLVTNVPYTRKGKFAFIDTEYPKREHKLKRVKKYLSPDMQSYWDQLIGD